MTQIVCMFLAIIALTVDWDPVRPGALVRKVGDMIIVNQSVRVLLKFDNLSIVRENVGHINQGILVGGRDVIESGFLIGCHVLRRLRAFRIWLPRWGTGVIHPCGRALSVRRNDPRR